MNQDCKCSDLIELTFDGGIKAGNSMRRSVRMKMGRRRNNGGSSDAVRKTRSNNVNI